MNRNVLLLVALLGLTFSLSAQDSNRWTFFETLDWGARLAYLQDQPAARSDGAFLLKVLQAADSDRIESGTDIEVHNKTEATVIALRGLAEHPVDGAAATIARLPRQYRDPALRAEAWLTLAKLGDKDSIPSLQHALESLNDSGLRTRAEEIQASAVIQALGLLKASTAFRAMWAASLGWYSPVSGIRALARKTLPSLVPDAEAATLELLQKDEDLTFREGVFLAIVDQNDAAATGRAAAAVLDTLVRVKPRDKADQDRAFRLTLEVLQEAQKTAAPPASLVPSLKLILSRAETSESVIHAIRLLAKISDPSAGALLSSTLFSYNAQQKAGTNTNQNLQYVRELIQALATRGQADARPALDDARFSGYSPSLAREAQDALEKLPKS